MENNNKVNFMALMAKIDHYVVWVLLLAIILYAVSGYGMTKGLISYDLARTLHFKILGPIGLVAFVLHAGWGIHLTFRRWGVWNRATKTVLIVFFLLLASFFVYVQFFYNKSDSKSAGNVVISNSNSSVKYSNANAANTVVNSGASNTNAANTNGTTVVVNSSVNSGASGTVFTADTLSQYNGKNGQPAYVAVDGKVYDLSTVFRNGVHEGWTAGQDLSAEFHQYHYDSILSGYAVVGTYQ